jgi:DNA adenine methylase
LSTVERPVARFHGGKFRLAPWIIEHLPAHRTYVEPFGGMASVLIRKPQSYAEIYNDRSGDLVNLFRVLRAPRLSKQLVKEIRLTPFAREEFELAYEPTDDKVERARRLLVRCGMGFGSTGQSKRVRTGFRGSATRSGTTPAHDWAGQPQNLEAVIERLRGVTIENRPAVKVIQYHDSPETLFYLDPPYVHDVRSWIHSKDAYDHEMSNDDHADLAKLCKAVSGMVVLSGYRCDLYDELYADWTRVDKAAHADGARDRVESLWLNPAASARLQPQLFEVDG